VARRSCQCRLTLAGYREAQAPSPSARRAWLLPVLVIAPCRRRGPLEDAEGGHRGDRHRARHATQGLERFDHRRETPGWGVFRECLGEPLQTFRRLGNGTDLCLAHNVLRWGRPAHCREPAEVGRVPGGLAWIAEGVPRPKSFQTTCGSVAITERI